MCLRSVLRAVCRGKTIVPRLHMYRRWGKEVLWISVELLLLLRLHPFWLGNVDYEESAWDAYRQLRPPCSKASGRIKPADLLRPVWRQPSVALDQRRSGVFAGQNGPQSRKAAVPGRGAAGILPCCWGFSQTCTAHNIRATAVCLALPAELLQCPPVQICHCSGLRVWS